MEKKQKVRIQKIKDSFSLEVITGENNLNSFIEVSDIKRPGIELAGFWKHFVPERIQLLGRTELSFLKGLDEETLKERINTFFSYDLKCVIVARGQDLPQILINKAREKEVPLLRTDFATTHFISQLTHFLEKELAPVKVIHGVLVDIYGIGVLIKGKSGIGKSETAVELVKRGHRLIADDIVEIRRITEEDIIGQAPEQSKYFLELRGIGIINVRRLFGAGAVKNEGPINMVTRLEFWDEAQNYERLGLDNTKTNILGVEVPELIIPVQPGRNLAVVLEVAAMNMRMKSMGYNAARAFAERVENKF